MEDRPHLSSAEPEDEPKATDKKVWDTSFMEKELLKEIAEHEQRLASTNEELRSIMDALTHYTEENSKLEEILFHLVNKIKKELAFASRCKRKYSLLSGLVEKSSLCLVAAQDMLAQCKNKTGFHLKVVERYVATLEDRSKFDNVIEEKILSYSYSFCRLNTGSQSKVAEEVLATATSSGNSIDEDIRPRVSSTSSKYRERERSLPTIVGERVKGFRPRQSSNWRLTGEQSDEPIFDLEINDEAIFSEIPKEKLFALGHTAASLRKDELAKLLSQYAFSDTTRKEFWRVRIGNKLRITRTMFENLQDRLNLEPISKKSEKVIIDDLDRTFPICQDIEEGRSMYTNMKLILSLFEVRISVNF